jgi:predicted DNA-binding protein with PD1-like motif
MHQLSFRLKPGQLFKEEIEKIAVDRGIKAGVLLSVVGGLENAVLRMAGSDIDNQTVKTWNKKFEIVSGTGTISSAGCHIHVALSDKEGKVIGGHLKDGCIVAYTVEVVIGIFDDVEYLREFDKETRFNELVVKSVE